MYKDKPVQENHALLYTTEHKHNVVNTSNICCFFFLMNHSIKKWGNMWKYHLLFSYIPYVPSFNPTK